MTLYLNKIGRVQHVTTFATIRFWYRTTAENADMHWQALYSCHKTLLCLSARNIMLPIRVLLLITAFLLEIVQLNNGFQRLLRAFLLAQQQLQRNALALQRIVRRIQRQLRVRRRPQPFWVLPRPQGSWFLIHYHDHAIPEYYFRKQLRMNRDIHSSPKNFSAVYYEREHTDEELSATRNRASNRSVPPCPWRLECQHRAFF